MSNRFKDMIMEKADKLAPCAREIYIQSAIDTFNSYCEAKRSGCEMGDIVTGVLMLHADLRREQQPMSDRLQQKRAEAIDGDFSDGEYIVNRKGNFENINGRV